MKLAETVMDLVSPKSGTEHNSGTFCIVRKIIYIMSNTRQTAQKRKDEVCPDCIDHVVLVVKNTHRPCQSGAKIDLVTGAALTE